MVHATTVKSTINVTTTHLKQNIPKLSVIFPYTKYNCQALSPNTVGQREEGHGVVHHVQG